MKNKNPIIQNDIMRYKRNKISGNLALLGIAFMCVYFMVMYAQIAKNIKEVFMTGEPVYTYLTGISVILNLVLLLAIFLSSEELKGYNKKFCYVVWVIAAIQIIRIFGYPMKTISTKLVTGKYILNAGTFVVLVACLAASAASLIAAGVTGFININRLEKYNADLARGAVDLDAALAEEAPAAPVAEVNVTETAELSADKTEVE